ncbi:MAG: universal stress protein [Croceitalea sp.]|nr:universal stress protein [Croceitalea sp.]
MINILLPTDFSENANNAIAYAMQLYKKKTCVFYLMHSYTPEIYRVDYVLGSPGQFGLPDDHQYISETQLEALSNKLQKTYKNTRHTFVTHTAFNSLTDEVDKTVQNEGIDLIVMGTQGATGARELFFGSNAVHVLKNAKVPVITVPANYKYKPVKEILFPTDFEIDYKKANLKYLFDLTKLHDARLHIMHLKAPKGLTKEQDKNQKQLSKLMKGSYKYHDLPDQELMSAINAFQKQVKVNLLVMVHNKHTFLERLFIEPVIKKIGLHALIPFMVLPYTD